MTTAKQGVESSEGPLGPPHGSDRKDRVEEAAAWGYANKHEAPWYPSLAVLVALLLWLALPPRFALPKPYTWIVPGLEILLLAPLVYARRNESFRGSQRTRVLSMALIALINGTNLLSLAELINHIVEAAPITGRTLLLSGGEIWLTNVIVFGLWFWELDRGGPHLRRTRQHRQPDFLFPQMATPYCAATEWAPDFVDYLYVAFTNATAFSPTDTMPLTNWAKLLMMVQSFASLITVGLVAARAVNILQG